MADVQPLRALRYDPAVVGPLADVVAPPYDVIDAGQRAALIARSPFNVVAIDLPEGEPDRYAAARELFESWQLQGALVRDGEPALWAHTQDYTGPDGLKRTRRGFFCRVRIEDYGPGRVRPHERTHPGPKEDRLRLTRATRANISPIFSLYSDPAGAAWQALAPATEQPPWADIADADGTVHRLWRVSDPAAIAAAQAATRDAELLIADGQVLDKVEAKWSRQISSGEIAPSESREALGDLAGLLSSLSDSPNLLQLQSIAFQGAVAFWAGRLTETKLHLPPSEESQMDVDLRRLLADDTKAK